MTQLEALMKDHFVEYASYFILDRAIPELRDGLKPVQRRILHTLFRMNDGRFHKVANVIGDTMRRSGMPSWCSRTRNISSSGRAISAT
jgi:topoisomerase-4 subunit A